MPTPIRALFLTTELGYGGAEKNLTRIATGLDRDQFDPIVCSIAPLPERRQTLVETLREADVPVRSLNASSARQFLGAKRRLRALIDELRPDVMQTFLFHANVLGAWGARGTPVRLVAGYRVADPRGWRLTLERWALKRTERAICVSESVRRFYLARRFPEAKLLAIPNAVDPPDRNSLARPSDYPDAPAGRVRAISVGRLHRQKGFDQGMRWIAAALDLGCDLDWTIVGDGPERSRLEAAARELSLSDRVHFAGWREEVAAWLASSDLYLLPSRWEGMPNALMEAMAVGLPVVAADVEGVAEVLGDESAFQSVDANNPIAAGERVAALAHDAGLRERLGEANRRRMLDRFSPASVVERYAAVYRELGKR